MADAHATPERRERGETTTAPQGWSAVRHSLASPRSSESQGTRLRRRTQILARLGAEAFASGTKHHLSFARESRLQGGRAGHAPENLKQKALMQCGKSFEALLQDLQEKAVLKNSNRLKDAIQNLCFFDTDQVPPPPAWRAQAQAADDRPPAEVRG